MTDVYTGWTEVRAVRNKAQVWVLEAMKLLEKRSPFPWLGMASDNGSEFINQHLVRFCEQEQISFSRTRPSRKNDNPYVEQKNYSVVRRAVGYARYEGERELELVNELYDWLRLQINFFKPVMKMVAKQRRGSRIWKKYDVPKTPYRRICERIASSKIYSNFFGIDFYVRQRVENPPAGGPYPRHRQSGWRTPGSAPGGVLPSPAGQTASPPPDAP